MVISAVLPANTSWGFNFASKPAFSPASNGSVDLTSQYHDTRVNLKRKVSFADRIETDSEDENHNGLYSRRMDNASTSENLNQSFQRPLAGSVRSQRQLASHHRIGKRARTHNIVGRKLPILRIVESLDRKGLQSLLETVCQSNPQVADQIIALAPRVTVGSAIDILKRHLEAIHSNLPYKGDPSGEYAYLRVRPHVEEFLTAFGDYTAHFLPPHEAQPSNTLAFLDDATSLLNSLPTWSNPIHNHQKYALYDDLTNAWIMGIKEASKRAQGLGLAHGGWESKLQQHNNSSGHRLQEAVEYIVEELSWLAMGNDNLVMSEPRQVTAYNGI